VEPSEIVFDGWPFLSERRRAAVCFRGRACWGLSVGSTNPSLCWEQRVSRDVGKAAGNNPAGGFAVSELPTAQLSENHWSRLWIGPVWCARFRGRMTATEYIFAVAMTLLIVWLVGEISITGALKGPRSMQREAKNRRT
jgi:hypothetical protein